MLCMTSPLGGDALIPISLSAQETISGPFPCEIRAVSQNGVIKPVGLLDRAVCVALQSAGSPVRYGHGIVRGIINQGRVRGAGTAKGRELYCIVAMPRLWFLSQTCKCGDYQTMNADDMMTAVFEDAGLTDMNGIPTGPLREYTVAFNATDLHFATRLMEEEGWFCLFAHADSQHTLVVARSNTAFGNVPIPRRT